MPYIYKITNIVNDKVYIGQTIRPLEDRFRQHIYDSRKNSKNKSIKLYNAMNKYGADKFSISIVEECNRSNLNEREKYWIKKCDSYKNGYNSTLGGFGRVYNDDETIMSCWENGMIVSDIVKATGHGFEFIVESLERNGISTEERRTRAFKVQSSKVKVPVYQYKLNGEYVAEHASVWDAEKETGILGSCINGVLMGKHYSAGGYQWSKTKTNNIGKCKHKVCYSSIPVHMYTIDGDYIRSFRSLSEASKYMGQTGIRPIKLVCIGKGVSSGGYRWSYEKVDKLPPIREKPNSNQYYIWEKNNETCQIKKCSRHP